MAYKANKSIIVKQATIDEMKKMGMKAAIDRANSTDDAEFREGAKRMYGNRIKTVMAKPRPAPQTGQNVWTEQGNPSKGLAKQDRSHVQGEAAAKPSLSKKASKRNYGSAEI